MAVKPITNPLPREKESVNRGEQISSRNVSIKNNGNMSKTTLPGKDFSKNYEIIIKDLDTTIMNHIKNVMKIKIEHNGEMVDVPLMYGNQERWVNVRKQGFMRDKNGALILPLLMMRRTNINFNDSLPSYKHDLTGEGVEVLRSSNWSKDNHYSRFSVQQGIKPSYRNIVTGVPQFVTVSYDVISWTPYIEQMNSVLEHFSDQHNRYWGDNTSYKFLCTVDGGLSDSVELTANTERIIKSNISLSLNGYLLPEIISNVINKKRFNTKHTLTKRKLIFSENIE